MRAYALAGAVCVLASMYPASAEVQHLYGPFFAADGVRSSRLLVHNKRGDLPVPVKIYVLTGRSGERSLLATTTLQPKESRAFELDADSLRATGHHATEGGLSVEYDFFEKQPLDATILVRHRNGARYVVPVLRRDQIRGTVQEAVFPLPAASVRAFLAIQNTADTPRLVTVEAEADDRRVTAATLQVAPQATEIVRLDEALARTGAREAAAIRVTNDGQPGDVMVAGALNDPQSKYSGRIRFNDLAHGEHSRTLRGQFLLLGAQERGLGLPPGATFAANVVLRNASETPKRVHPRVKWLDGSVTREAVLPLLNLRAREVRLVDLTAAQSRGEIPAGFHFGVLEVPYEGGTGHVFAQLTNVDTTTGLVLDGSLTSHESHAVAGMEWTVEGDRQTLLSITNASPRLDVIHVQLFDGSTTIDLPPLQIASGAIALLNLRSIANDMVLGTTSGTFSVRGAHGTRSAFRLERLMVVPGALTADSGQTTQEGPVMYVDTEGEERVIWIRTESSEPAPTEDFPPETAYITLDLTTIARWSSGTSYTDETDYVEYSTNDTATLAIKHPPQPQVTAYIPIYRPPNIGDLLIRFTDPCSYMNTVSTNLSFGLPASAYEIYNSGQYPICWWSPTCTGTCGSGFHSSRALTPSCYPAGQPYIQCFGLSVNGRCVVRIGVCTFQSTPGFCT